MKKCLDSSKIVNKLYKSINESHHVVVEPAKRSHLCSLENAINVNIDGKLFCLAHIGQTKHKNALQLCQDLNATLPLPKSIKEHKHLVESFKRLDTYEKLSDLSTKIVLHARRFQNKGKASSLFAFNLQIFDFYSA